MNVVIEFGSGLLIFILSCLVVILLVALFVSLISWFIHLSMSSGENKIKGIGSYRKFKTEFKKAPVVWISESGGFYAQDVWNFSLDKNKNYRDPFYEHYRIFASIYKFDGKIMIFSNPITYAMVVLFLFKYKIMNNGMYKW